MPAPPTFKGKRFPSIEAALADGPKFFEELMSAVGSRDGREVVRALEDLQGEDRDRARQRRALFHQGRSSGPRLAAEIPRLDRRQSG